MAQPALPRAAFLDPLDDRGVEPDAGVEAEEPSVHPAQADRAQVGHVETAGQQFDGGNGVVRHPDRPGEHVGRTAREHPERRVGAGDTGGHFVQRAVAAEPDHHIDPASGGVVGESGGVAAAVRLDDLTSWPGPVLRAG